MAVSGQLHAPAALSPRQIDAGAHLEKDGWSSRVSLDSLVKINLATFRNRTANPRPSSPQHIHYTVFFFSASTVIEAQR